MSTFVVVDLKKFNKIIFFEVNQGFKEPPIKIVRRLV
jgi:hypothetical protein